MTADPYNAALRKLFAETAHAGSVDNGSCVLVDDQGLRVSLSASVADGQIETMRFRAWGCPHLLAAAEAVCRWYEGRALPELQAFSAAEIMQTLPVPREKLGRILVLEDAVRSLGQSVRVTPDEGEDTD